jgi:predicted transcriptional regulator
VVKNYKPEKNVEIRGDNLYVIAPPSLNEETGVFYSWLRREGDFPPILSREQILELFPQTQLSIPLIECLPFIVHEILVNRNIMHYETNSEAENAVVWSLVRTGWDNKSIIELFNHFCPPHYKSRNCSEDWLQTQMIDKCRKEITVYPYMEKIRGAVDWATEKSWDARTGNTDGQVFLACCKRAMIEGINNFRATEREIANLANIARKTAGKSLGRLVKENILEVIQDKSSGKHYKISQEAQDYPIKSTVLYFNGVMSSSLIEHDVWHPNALGKTSYIVYQFLLTNGGKNILEISEGTNKSKDRVTEALDKLSRYRLTLEKDGIWIAIMPRYKRYLNVIAMVLGTFGMAEKRKQQYQKEREKKAYHAFMKS